MTAWQYGILLSVSAASLLCLAAIAFRMFRKSPESEALDSMERRLTDLAQRNALDNAERVEQAKGALQQSLTREMSAGFLGFGEKVERQIQDSRRDQETRLAASVTSLEKKFDALRDSTEKKLEWSSNAQSKSLRESRDELKRAFQELVDSNERRLGDLKNSVETKLSHIQKDNAEKLEQMRKTVDEKLEGTLEKRLGESFRQVSLRLEQVHKGLGEMQSLANGVGDLKKVLTNVKTRGSWGEMQLANLLEQLLIPEQYAANVATRPGSNERVEYAIKMPGRNPEDNRSVWLPIDAKFPKEDYERLVEASELADPEKVETAAKQLESRIRLEARTIHEKYIEPPHTTDFAILYLPTEGLYAEVLRRPGLQDVLQREYRVTIAGPTVLSALLNSLQMGFRTLAIEQRSSEVWNVLGAVKNEFTKFGDVLGKVRKKLSEAGNVIDSADRRTRAINRKLRDVESLPGEESAKLLEIPAESDEVSSEEP